MSLDLVSRSFGIFSSIIAAIALLWNVHVFNETSKNNAAVLEATVAQQNESAAVELHNSYLNLAFQNPEFAFGEQDAAKMEPKAQQRYTLFAIATVRVAERLFALTRGQPLWQRSIDEMLASHLKFIAINFSCQDFNADFGQYLKARVDDLSCR